MREHKHIGTHTMAQKAVAVFRIRIHIDLTLLDPVPYPHW